MEKLLKSIIKVLRTVEKAPKLKQKNIIRANC